MNTSLLLFVASQRASDAHTQFYQFDKCTCSCSECLVQMKPFVLCSECQGDAVSETDTWASYIFGLRATLIRSVKETSGFSQSTPPSSSPVAHSVFTYSIFTSPLLSLIYHWAGLLYFPLSPFCCCRFASLLCQKPSNVSLHWQQLGMSVWDNEVAN